MERDGVDRAGPERSTSVSTWPVSTWPVDSAHALAVAVRSGRRRLALNQRELAARAGVHQATVARLEAERDVSFSVALAVLGAVGARLAALGPAVVERPEDSARDTGGRRLPAHLEVRQVDRLPLGTHLRRSYRGGPPFRLRGEFWVYSRPYPWPQASDGVSPGDP